MNHIVFHIFTVRPKGTAPHELNQVMMADYLVKGATLEAAFAEISDSVGVADAFEVWSAEMCGPVLMTPDSRHNTCTEFGQHLHWSSVQTRYQRIRTGKLGLAQHFEAQFEAYLQKSQLA